MNFTSLYPSVQKDFKYPVSHPSILIGKECDNVDFHHLIGLVKCDMLLLKQLYFPILPSKINGKLLFVLCYSCAVEKNNECHHAGEQRLLSGVWCSPEIKKALEMGHKIVKVYEVYESANDIFSSFVKYFMKLKQQCSGFPHCYDVDGLVDKIISDYLKQKSVLLDKAMMYEVNPGVHTIMKLILNALWGQFGQNEDKI